LKIFTKEYLSKNTELMSVIKSFYFNETSTIYLYLKNFGGLFASRTRDGMIMGYLDRLFKIGQEDHATIFFNSEQGFVGLHRTVRDESSTVYLRYSMDYITNKNGLKDLFMNLYNDRETPSYIKTTLFIVFFEIRFFYGLGIKKIFLLSKTKAKDLKMKSPCIFVETNFIGKIHLAIFAKIIKVIKYVSEKNMEIYPLKVSRIKNFHVQISPKKQINDYFLIEKFASLALTRSLRSCQTPRKSQTIRKPENCLSS
jgi:hypothetical protein